MVKVRRLNLLCFFLGLLFIVIIANSCVEHNLEEVVQCTSPETISFSVTIKPIIEKNCAIVGDGGCHDGGNGPTRDWRKFENFQDHRVEVKRRITLPESSPGHMPKKGKLEPSEIQLIVCWVEQGGQNN